MKIALLSTCAVATPPRGYGGTELVVAELAREYVSRGHDVTLFATADSTGAGKLRALLARPHWPPSDLVEVRHAGFAWQEIAAGSFDVVHANHAMHLPFSQLVDVPTVFTVHHHRDEALLEHYLAHPNVHFVGISRRQVQLSPELRFAKVIHHGVDETLYPAGDGRGGYLAFLGRFDLDKAPHIAIDAAVRAGVPLRLGGKPHDLAYHEREVVPRLARHAGLVSHLGEVIHEPKIELLRHASAMLFPIQWEEPFGLVMIESMLVGTPVIAFRHGAAPEVIDEGVTGFLVDDVDEMTARIAEVAHLDRRACRQHALERFTTRRMAARYLELYEGLVRHKHAQRRRHVAHAHHASPTNATHLVGTPGSAARGGGGGHA
jgi:glycosyltransferase involved in cell wall biosynthesis